jgi:hypothetical protein
MDIRLLLDKNHLNSRVRNLNQWDLTIELRNTIMSCEENLAVKIDETKEEEP